ncbi:MAG: cobalamin-dependent protein [Anaerolineaceae bacterium]|nr:cobalamin-dependent protein [Anaerolineaceae bacterium]
MNFDTRGASEMILERSVQLSQQVVDKLYGRSCADENPSDAEAHEKSVRDVGYHFSYLAESLAAEDIHLFLDYAAWVKGLFRSLHFRADILVDSLTAMKEAVEETLPPEQSQAAGEYLSIAIGQVPEMPEKVESFIHPESPYAGLAKNYLEAVLRGNRYEASELILTQVDQGVRVREIYLHVFQPCQYEIGRLWHSNQISVAQEHFATVVTQMVMSQLFPKIFSAHRNGHRVVATTVSGELHEIGMRMVADFLEMEGWDTYYLGASTPVSSILRTIEERKPEIIAISATISTHVDKVRDMIRQIRSTTFQSPVKIMVGGYPFNVSENLWKKVGADGYARNANEVIREANRLLSELG